MGFGSSVDGTGLKYAEPGNLELGNPELGNGWMDDAEFDNLELGNGWMDDTELDNAEPGSPELGNARMGLGDKGSRSVDDLARLGDPFPYRYVFSSPPRFSTTDCEAMSGNFL